MGTCQAKELKMVYLRCRDLVERQEQFQNGSWQNGFDAYHCFRERCLKHFSWYIISKLMQIN